MFEEKDQNNVHLCNALIDMFSKCVDVDKALKLFGDITREQLFLGLLWLFFNNHTLIE